MQSIFQKSDGALMLQCNDFKVDGMDSNKGSDIEY